MNTFHNEAQENILNPFAVCVYFFKIPYKMLRPKNISKCNKMS